MVADKAVDVFDIRFDPDFTGRTADFGIGALLWDFAEVNYRCRSEFPLSKDRRRVVSTQKLIPADSVSRENSSPAEFSDTSPA